MAWKDTKTLSQSTNQFGLPPLKVTTVDNTANVAMTSTDRAFFITNVPIGGTNVDLVAANSVPAGTIVNILKFDGTTRSVGFTRNGSDTINGGTTLTSTTAYQSFAIMSDGTSKWTRCA